MDVSVSVYRYEVFHSPFHLAKLKQFYTSFYFLFFFPKAEKKAPEHWTPFFTNTLQKLAPCYVSHPGLWPLERCHVTLLRKQDRWAGVDGYEKDEGWHVVSPNHPWLLTHPLLPSDQFPLGHFMARWDAVRRGVTQYSVAPAPPHPFKWIQFTSQLRGVGSVWGAAVGGAGCGSHCHAWGARRGHWLADVGHKEGVTGQLVHINAVLLTVD